MAVDAAGKIADEMTCKFKTYHMRSSICGITFILQRAGLHVTDIPANCSGLQKLLTPLIMTQDALYDAKLAPKINVDVVNI